jgi:hypothetical protein
VNITANDTYEENVTFFLFNSTNHTIREVLTNQSNRSINFTSVNIDGLYYYNVTVVDRAGNFNFTETRSVLLDNQYPIIDFTPDTLPSGSYANQDYVFVNVTAYDGNERNITFYLYNFTDITDNENLTLLSSVMFLRPVVLLLPLLSIIVTL